MPIIFRWFWYLLPGNPVLVAIVRSGSRCRSHLWVRTVYLGMLMILAIYGLLAGGGMGDHLRLTELAKAGNLYFSAVSSGQIVMICLLSPLFMSGAIAQQKTGRIYDVLLSTPLTSFQIVLGSLFGRLILIWLLLASGLPCISVLLILGGVPMSAVWISFVVAGLSALFIGSVAVALSVWGGRGRQAIFVFVMTVGTYLVAIYLLDLLLLRQMVGSFWGSQVHGTTALTPLHPLLVLEASFLNATYQLPDFEQLGHLHPWWRFYLTRPLSVFTCLSVLTSSGLVLACTITLRRAVTRQGESAWTWRCLPRWLSRMGQMTGRRTPRRVWANPVAWRESRTRGNRTIGVLCRWVIVVLGMSVAVTLLVFYHHGRLPAIPDPVGGGVMAQHDVFRLLLQALLQVELAAIVLIAVYISAGCVSREREEGTLDLILISPMAPRQVVWGKLQGLVRFLALLLSVPVLTVLMSSAYTQLGHLFSWQQVTVVSQVAGEAALVDISQSTDLILLEAPLLLLVVQVPFVALSLMVGMSWSLRAKGVLGAVGPAVTIVCCLMMVLGFCGSNLAANVPLVGGAINALSPATHLMVLINPWKHVSGFGQDPVTGRWLLLAGSLVAGGVCSVIAYLMLLTMVQNYDQTVRRWHEVD